ncbi:MAG: hypothetical protein RJB25_156 [Bacteroidota bacterium]
MLTSGGYNFNSECVNYVTSRSEIENIVDCFGTARCPPPLAIRQTLKDTSFDWVNEFIKLGIKEGTNELMFSTEQENVFNELSNSFANSIVTNDTRRRPVVIVIYSSCGNVCNRSRINRIRTRSYTIIYNDVI